jgi:hypothetical protein
MPAIKKFVDEWPMDIPALLPTSHCEKEMIASINKESNYVLAVLPLTGRCTHANNSGHLNLIRHRLHIK